MKVINYILVVLRSLRAESKWIDKGNGVAVYKGVDIERGGVGNASVDDVGAHKALEIRVVEARAHVQQTVGIAENSVPSVIAEYQLACARSACLLAVCGICDRIGDISVNIRYGDHAAAVVVVVHLIAAVRARPYEPLRSVRIGGHLVQMAARPYQPASSACAAIGNYNKDRAARTLSYCMLISNNAATV